MNVVSKNFLGIQPLLVLHIIQHNASKIIFSDPRKLIGSDVPRNHDGSYPARLSRERSKKLLRLQG